MILQTEENQAYDSGIKKTRRHKIGGFFDATEYPAAKGLLIGGVLTKMFSAGYFGP